MTVFVSIHDRVALLPFFLRYYTKLGATLFVYTMPNGDQNPCWDELYRASQGYRWVCKPFSQQQNVFIPAYDAASMNEARQELAYPDEWIVVADLDEFVYCDGQGLAEIAQEAARKQKVRVWARMVDRVAADGTFPPLRQDLTLDEQFPLAAHLTEWAGACSVKCWMQRADQEISMGHHGGYAEAGLWRGLVYHFKWHGVILDYIKLEHERMKAEYAKTPGLLTDWMVLHYGWVTHAACTPNWIAMEEAEAHPAERIGV